MISGGICNSWKRQILEGVHQAGDVYRIALYSSSARLDASTEFYTPQGEVSGQGYTAGGQELYGLGIGMHGEAPCLSWAVAPCWPDASFAAAGALVYNNSRGKRAVLVLDFGREVTAQHEPFFLTAAPRIVLGDSQ